MRSKLRTTLATAAAAALVLGSAGVALADNVKNDLESNPGAGTAVAGSFTTVGYYLQATGSGGCDATASTPVVVSFPILPGGVSVSPSELNFTTCNVVQDVEFHVAAGTAAGDHNIEPAAVGQNTSPAKFTLKITAPAASDTSAPVITPTVDGTLGEDGWYTSDVTVSWSVVDPESEVTSSTGCETATVDYDTAGATVNCSATSAGGTSSESVTVKRDATKPVVTWGANSPADGATYYFGDPIPTADCTADDATSGVDADGCQVTGGGTAVGSHTLTAKATDNAGNETTENRTYTVLAWTLDGFYRPVDMGTGKLNTVKAGSTVPLKFNVFKGDERLTKDIGAEFTVRKAVCDSDVTEDAIEEFDTTGKTQLRFDEDGQQWIQNWATPKAGKGNCYAVTVTTADGSSLSAKFLLK
jgi:hypothetical protein